MGIMQQALGLNLTKYDPLIDSPFSNSRDQGEAFPLVTYFMITETGDFMLDENGVDLMIVE